MLSQLRKSTPEDPEYTCNHKAAFFKGFTNQWWAAGVSFRAATLAVNTALRPRLRYGPKESSASRRKKRVSPFGKIAEHRYQMLEMPLHGAINVGTLFKRGEETVRSCLVAPNEYMEDGHGFSQK